MPTIDEAAAIALALPEVEERERHGSRTWFIGKQGFAWERGYTKADLRRFGDEVPPEGPLLAVRTADLAEKEGVLAAGRRGVFTISHFDGYPAVLIQLRRVGTRILRELIVDAWLACAPAPLAAEHAASLTKKR